METMRVLDWLKKSWHESPGDFIGCAVGLLTPILFIPLIFMYVNHSIEKGAHGGKCPSILACYRQFDAFGVIESRLKIRVNASGEVQGVEYEGSAPDKVKDCLVKRAHSLSPMDTESAGTVVCTWVGKYIAGNYNMSSSVNFKPAD